MTDRNTDRTRRITSDLINTWGDTPPTRDSIADDHIRIACTNAVMQAPVTEQDWHAICPLLNSYVNAVTGRNRDAQAMTQSSVLNHYRGFLKNEVDILVDEVTTAVREHYR